MKNSKGGLPHMANRYNPPNPIRRFWAKVEKNSETMCWPWLGPIRGPKGYGSFRVNGKTIYVHRFSYELHLGPIPAGLTIDHLCRNRICVNPDHLEAVPIRVNVLRGTTLPAENAAKTHCPQGHEYTPKNTYNGHKGKRQCRACGRERWAMRSA